MRDEKSGRGTRDEKSGHGTRDTGHGTRDTGHGTRDMGRKILLKGSADGVSSERFCPGNRACFSLMQIKDNYLILPLF